MRIREAAGSDHPDIRQVVLAAFAEEPQVADLVDELRVTRRVRNELVAVDDAAVVGHVLLSRGWVDDDEELAPALVLSPLGVLPEAQRHGVGTTLVRAALDAARNAGESLVFLEGDPGYYGTRGFERAGRRGFLAPSQRIPAPAFQVALLGEQRHRGRLVYADAFWALDCVGLRGDELSSLREILGD